MFRHPLGKFLTRSVGLALTLWIASASEVRPLTTSDTIADTMAEGIFPGSNLGIANFPDLGLIPETLRLAQSQQSRVALVIGNAAYEDDLLNNPVNDATAIYETLDGLGFDVLPPLLNANKEQIVDALRDFQDRLEPGGVGVFYYAGHGVQVNGKNYLVPIAADLERQAEAEFEAVDLDRVIRMMNDAETQFNVLLIDACRDNPFYRKWPPTRGSNIQGLAEIRPPWGTIISYSTGSNQVAEDGEGRNSPYTTSLLKHLASPSLHILHMLSLVADDVVAETQGKQFPSFEGSMGGDFSFNPIQDSIVERNIENEGSENEKVSQQELQNKLIEIQNNLDSARASMNDILGSLNKLIIEIEAFSIADLESELSLVYQDIYQIQITLNLPSEGDISSSLIGNPDVNFACYTSPQGIPTTYGVLSFPIGRTEYKPLIRWQSEYSSSFGYTPERKCLIVSRRFQYFSERDQLKYLTIDYQAGQNVICASSNPTGCDGILITLEPSEDPQAILEALQNTAWGTGSPIFR
jgi:hypothetical protein